MVGTSGGTYVTVLIVDDDLDIRTSFVEVLADEGITAASAANGRDALAYLASHELPRLIVLDLMMPVMTGMEFRQRQLAAPQLASIPVVVMSVADHGSALAMQLGVEAFLPKPVRMDQLISAVHRYC